jgi:hypothetical protein
VVLTILFWVLFALLFLAAPGGLNRDFFKKG